MRDLDKHGVTYSLLTENAVAIIIAIAIEQWCIMYLSSGWLHAVLCRGPTRDVCSLHAGCIRLHASL